MGSDTDARPCTPMSTGAILLADIIPSFVIKSLSPFLPYNANFRVLISCATAIVSFIAVAFARSRTVVILGVALTSFASGLGEPTFLAHSTHYNKNVVSTWSSGTGGAGIIGALSYSLLREIGLSSRQTLLLMILVPILEICAFFMLLSKPTRRNRTDIIDEREPLLDEQEIYHEIRNQPPLNTLNEKFEYIPQLMVYFVPLASVYFFEYFINQGLVRSNFDQLCTQFLHFSLKFELVTFPDSSLTPPQQYRWYQVTYQIGVFVSRSSVNLFQIKRTWIMAVIQGVIAMFFFNEAVFLFTPSIAIIFVVIFIEGLQGGLAYVNTYYKMSKEISCSRKEFAMNIVACSDSIGIILAGFLAIPTHNWICQLPSEADY